MLTLADAAQLGQVLVYRDVIFPGGVRTLTSTFYLLRVQPGLAVDGSGAPAWSFFWYRGTPGVTARTGGLLLLTVTLTVPPDPSLVAQIRQRYGLAADAPVDLADVPVDSATTQLWLGGDGWGSAGPGGEFARAVLGGGEAQVTAAGTSFAVVLTPDGAALLDAALTADRAVLQVSVDLILAGCLDQDRLRVWCDTDAVAQLSALGDRQQIVRQLLERRHAGLEVTATDPTQAQALTLLGQSILTDAIATALARPDDGIWRQRCNVEISDQSARGVNVSCAGALTLPSTPDVLAHSLSTFDIDRWPPPFAVVQVRCVGDLDALAVDAVKVSLSASGATVSELVLRPGDGPAIVRFNLATPDQRAYQARVEVHYHHEDQPYVLDLPDLTDEVLVLDAGTFGVLRVQLGLRLAPPALIRRATVELVHDNDSTITTSSDAAGLADADFSPTLIVLDGGQPQAQWLRVVRDRPPIYRYRVTWVTDTASVSTDWIVTDATRLDLQAPDTLLHPAQVQVVSAGDFSGVSNLLAELRDGPDAPVTTLNFAAAGVTQTWPHATGPYQTRRTTLVDGQPPMVGTWRDLDQPLVIVRDDTRIDVTIVARLLDLGGELRLATVELAEASTVDSVAQTLVLTRPGDSPVWTYRPPGDDHSYRYRLTLIPTQGERRRTDWHTVTSTILVLTPQEAVSSPTA